MEVLEGKGRQVEAMEGKRKLWKRVEEAGQGLESNSTLHCSKMGKSEVGNSSHFYLAL